MASENSPKPVPEEEESQWSLSSLEQLKGLNLEQLREEDADDNHKEASIPLPQKNKIEPKFPPPQEVNADTKLFEVGRVMQKVGELLIVEASSCVNLVDLDNWLFNQNRECLGFVIDIFGRVDHPYYAIKLLESLEKSLVDSSAILGLVVYYAEGCKTLTEEDIKSIQEKSSMHKEADGQSSSSSQEQSDEEVEFRSNVVMHKKERNSKIKRRGSFEEPPYHQRERTREKRPARRFQLQDNHRRRHQDSRPINEINRDRQHNQAYLENMYSTYYHQMMQLYNGQNGMPLPKPVFPFFQPHPQTMQPVQPPQFNQTNAQTGPPSPFFYGQSQLPQFPHPQPPQ